MLPIVSTVDRRARFRAAWRAAVREEGGWAIVTAIVLMMVMLVFGLATLAQVDVQQRQSGTQRVKETSLGIAEAALQAQALRLRTRWPRTSAAALPAACETTLPAAPAGDPCPDAAQLTAMFGSTDLPPGSVLRTTLRDDASIGSGDDPWYDPATVPSAPTWDANGNGRMWVRSDATVRGHRRSVVALLTAPRTVVQAPRQVLMAARLSIGTSTPANLIDTVDGTPASLSVRCDAGAGTTPGCMEARRGTQLDPDTLRPDPEPSPTALDARKYGELRSRAAADGTFFANGCPELGTSPAGGVVYIGRVTCGYAGAVTSHSVAQPGILVVERGVLSLAGSRVFNGLIYHRNLDDVDDDVINMTGNSRVDGGVFADFSGGVRLDSGSTQLAFDRNAPWPDLAIANDHDLQLTAWRELPRS